jgi:signal transduction histidine kinase
MFIVCLLILSGIGWMLSLQRERQSAFFMVIGLSAIIFLADAWFQIPGTLSLLSIPIWLATAMIGWQAALGVALMSTILAFVLSWYGILMQQPAPLWLSALSIWSAVGVAIYMQVPARRLARWSKEYYENARQRLVEAGDRQVELSQALDDLMHANGQLALLNERIASYRQAAEEARRSKEMFVARVSHEFRAPLNVIIGMVSLMVDSAQVYDSPIPALAMQQLEVIHRSCRHLAGMIDDCLGSQPIRRWAVDSAPGDGKPDRTDRISLVIVRPLLEAKALELHVNYPQEIPPIYCDRLRIRQVILNLLSNAVRYTEKGSITVDVSLENENVYISITDTRAWYTLEDARRVFEPFSPVGQDIRRLHGGSGLGLSISKQFVELHDGAIGVESQPGQAVKFWFRLPLNGAALPVARPDQWISDKWIWVERRSTSDHPAWSSNPGW